MTRDEFDRALMTTPFSNRELRLHDAEQRQVIEQQGQHIATLREALGKLVKEIDGILGIGEEQIRNIVGNTNVNVLHIKIATAQQALKEVNL